MNFAPESSGAKHRWASAEMSTISVAPKKNWGNLGAQNCGIGEMCGGIAGDSDL